MESKENKEQIEEKFQAKLQGLLEMAKKKKMVIEDTEIIRYFNDAQEIELNLERMEQIFSFLESHNVDILTITEEDDDEELLLEDLEEDVDVDKIDISVPDGVSIDRGNLPFSSVRHGLRHRSRFPLTPYALRNCAPPQCRSAYHRSSRTCFYPQ